ncbi:hypothetical protein FNV43_RR06513 [Rhamnella rubrinervis]|uniref:Uncharacterized protein n=1 Tax=Rhamnella rubrinervis TaxID=2594499 RepID=A0A8K0HD74_9ROSA|nr:hypothetical protein FNV43_RR06513 [Rhamnella rubrinervis]
MAIQWILEVRRILVGSCVLSVVEVLAAGLVVGILCTAGLPSPWSSRFSHAHAKWSSRYSFSAIVRSAVFSRVASSGRCRFTWFDRGVLVAACSILFATVVTKLLADPALFSGRDPLRFFFVGSCSVDAGFLLVIGENEWIQDGTKHVDMDSVLAKHPNITSNLQQTERILAETAKVSSNSKPVVDHVLPSSSKTSEDPGFTS